MTRRLLWFVWFISFIWLNETNQINLSNQTNQGTATLSQSDSDKVNVPSFDVRADELYSYLVSDVEAALSRHHFPLYRRLKESDPRTSIWRTRHDGVEALADPRFE